MKFDTMVRHANRRSTNKGFTLLELLLVMAILVVLAGLGTVAYARLGTSSNIKACNVQISEIKKTCMAYKLQNQVYPRSLQDLVVLPSGMSQAEWGGPFFTDGKLPRTKLRIRFPLCPTDLMELKGLMTTSRAGMTGSR